MGISNGAVIVIAIVVAGFVVITGAVIFKFQAGRGAADGEGDGEYYNQRSNDQEHYSKCIVPAVLIVAKLLTTYQ
jgi:hypothetical protein